MKYPTPPCPKCNGPRYRLQIHALAYCPKCDNVPPAVLDKIAALKTKETK